MLGVKAWRAYHPTAYWHNREGLCLLAPLLVVVLAYGGAGLWWQVQLRGQDMPLGPLLHTVSPSCWAFEALALHTLHLIAETSFHVFSLLRHEWSLSFHPSTHDRLVEIFVQASISVHRRGTLCSQDMLPLYFSWSSLADFLAVGYEKGPMRTPEYATRRFLSWVSSSLGVGPVLVIHSLASVSPYLHASQSNPHHPWLTSDF